MALDSQTIPDGPIWAWESVTNRKRFSSGAVWCHIQAGLLTYNMHYIYIYILYLGWFDPYKPYKALEGLLRLTSWGSSGPCLGQLGPIFEQTWVYLRLFEAILGNLEAILGTSCQKEFLEGPRVSVRAIFGHVGTHVGWFHRPFFGPFWMILWTIFGLLFGPLLGTILGPIFGPDRPKRGQDEPKRAIRSFKDQKTAFSKPLKNIWFLHVFGSRGFPREPQEAQEGSQEAPKDSKT